MTSCTPASRAPSTAAFTSWVSRWRLALWNGDAGSVCSSRATPATPSMSADMKTLTSVLPQHGGEAQHHRRSTSRDPVGADSIRIAMDDVVLAPLLLLVERAVLEVADADRR